MHVRSFGPAFVAGVLAVGMTVVQAPVELASSVPWNFGDVFAAVGTGNYKVYNNDGTGPKDVINNGSAGVTAGCSFNPAQTKLYTTDWSGDNIIVFDAAVTHSKQATINTTNTGAADNESVVFANDGSFYVGHADGNHALAHYDASGGFLKEYFPKTERRGTDWNDLANDQKTMFYTSEGTHVKRFDVSSATQLADFNSTALSGSAAYALRLLPPGDGSGGLLVADTDAIRRLDAAGNVVQTYTAPGETVWFALNLDPNGTSFWSGSLSGTGNFYRFNISSGKVEVGPIVAGMSGFGAGLCLLGETTAAVSKITLSPSSATNPTGTTHTVTATVTVNGQPAQGVQVTFSIVSGPDTGASGTCSADASCKTDSNGQVSFTYKNNGTPGTDVIQACFTDKSGAQQCAKATKIWMGDAPITAKGTTFSATEGQTFSGSVATVTDSDPNDMAAEYSASIAWGDGATSAGTLSGPNGGPYNVNGSHLYSEEGSYTVKVHVTDSDSSNTADAASTASVADANLTAKCAMGPFIPQSYTGPTATFSDASSTGTLSDFSATISWGDASSSPGTITGGPGNAPYTVSGSHTYGSTGAFVVTTDITDVGGAKASASCAITVFAFPTSKGATFVIGDLEALPTTLPGSSEYFWGSQWDQMNPMTGPSPSPSQMKGFAGFEDNILGLPPACGGSWTTDPGNSSGPPATIPSIIAVIVSSNITQSGSDLSGDIKHIAIIKVNPGYGPNPGSPGTGTYLGNLC